MTLSELILKLKSKPNQDAEVDFVIYEKGIKGAILGNAKIRGGSAAAAKQSPKPAPAAKPAVDPDEPLF